MDDLGSAESLFTPYISRWINDKYTWKVPLDLTGVVQREPSSPSSQLFTWDPSIHNGWVLNVDDCTFYHASSTMCRYNYLIPDPGSLHALTGFFDRQGRGLHPMLQSGEITLDDWTWSVFLLIRK